MIQRLIRSGHRYGDVMNYTLAQVEAFIVAAEREDRERLSVLLAVIATGTQGDGRAIEKMQRELWRAD